MALIGALLLVNRLMAVSVSESQYWPTHVTLTQPLKVEVKGREKVLEPGSQALVLRNEGDQLLVHFPRGGHVVLDPNATDFFLQAEGIKAGEIKKNGPVMLSYLAHCLFDPTHGQQRKLSSNDLIQFEYIVFAYADFSDPEARAAIRALGELHQGQDDPQWTALVFPSGIDRAEFKELVLSGEIQFPIIYYHLSEGYKQLLKHEPASPFALVVSDADGATLAPMVDSTEPGALEALVENLSAGEGEDNPFAGG